MLFRHRVVGRLPAVKILEDVDEYSRRYINGPIA
jgi:hypothetical protein